MYSLDRLTAPKPEWNFAFIFVKGMADPLGIDNKSCKARWLREENLLEITVPRVQDPTNPPTEGGVGPNGIVPPTPGGLAKLVSYVHIDEIIAVNFYNSFTEEDYKAIGAKVRPKEDFLKTKEEEEEVFWYEEG
jgi:hypothetical protein